MSILIDIYTRVINLINSPQFLRAIFDNRFILILLVIFLMRAKYATYRSMWLSALVNIPGTFLHELMHFFVGAFLNAQPCGFSILPKRDEYGNYVMGSVSFRNITFYNAIPAALAPLLLLPIGFYLNRYLLPVMKPTLFNYMLYILVQTIIIENAIPSRADFNIAGRDFKGIILYSVLFLAFLLFL